MATSSDMLSLSQLLDLAIGMPKNEKINFSSLKQLLQIVLEHLDGQYLVTQEPWMGELSGPSLAELAREVKEMKEEMESYKKIMSEEIGGIKAEHCRVSEDIRKIQEVQFHMEEDLKKMQKDCDQALADSQNHPEEIGLIKTTQTRMAREMKEVLAMIKKMEDDIAKLREDMEKWKEETSEQITQQIEKMVVNGTVPQVPPKRADHQSSSCNAEHI